MITWRIIGTRMGQKIVGDWQKDVPYILEKQIKVWVGRKENFSVEFK